MTDRATLWSATADVAKEGAPAALATVARRRGSLPMASDAKMLVTASGERWGTVGGGCVEADVMTQALETLSTGEPALVQHALNADIAGDLGLSCGGTVSLFVEPVPSGAPAAALFTCVSQAILDRRSGIMATAMRWEDRPRKFARVEEDVVSIGDWEPQLPESSAEAPYMDPTIEAFVEPVPRTPRLVLFGAGHVGREIARAATGTGFHVVVVDDRDEFANVSRFPDAAELRVQDLRDAMDGMSLDSDDYVIACTRGHAMDAIVVERVANSAARYVGLLGSRRKRAVLWNALERAGVAREALDRVKVPIGEDIGADTPAEIGIAVMAELIRIRRRGDLTPGAD